MDNTQDNSSSSNDPTVSTGAFTARHSSSVADQDSAAEGNHLLYFYGTECTHCHEMDEPMERLSKEEGLVIKKLECWHDEQNARLLEQYDQGLCGGVPFLYNTKTGKFICGTCDYETLKNWAHGV